ncbi:MAG TPA: aspartate:alanine exchanger family transporter, partial [Thermoanaerobaculia bacterium]|nr:aspartate:alanine exchanger family transporter [Thermoanaerobaculia bacterium]
MIQLLLANPLLLLFAVAAIGYPLGQIRIGGFSLGVAAVLFTGLAAGSLHPDLKLPEIVYLLGLVVFVYSLGLAGGPGFVASFRRRGVRDNLLVLGMILLAAGMTAVAGRLFGLAPGLLAGLFAGSLTNTPALAAVLESLRGAPAPSGELLALPVMAYSVAYPMGVVGMILAIFLLQRRFRVDYAAEAAGLADLGAVGENLMDRTIRVTRPEAAGAPVGEIIHQHRWRVLFVRVERGGEVSMIDDPGAILRVGDRVSVVGSEKDLDAVTAFLGEPAPMRLSFDRRQVDFRRVFVSSPEVAGKRLAEIALPQRFGALVTRVRRGDADLLPRGDTVLELGDRVRVVAPRARIEEVGRFFGDSYKAVSELDVVTFSLGLVLGLLLGLLPIPLPGFGTFRLGLAGGPLLVGLTLGALGRTGPLLWQVPYGVNLTLRQIGVVLFLAGIGTRSGWAFASTFRQGGGLTIFLCGAAITCVTAFLTLWIGHRVLKIPMSLLTGMLGGLQTQPAVLAYAGEQAKNDLPAIGYATVYPVATIGKILLAQLLLRL